MYPLYTYFGSPDNVGSKNNVENIRSIIIIIKPPVKIGKVKININAVNIKLYKNRILSGYIVVNIKLIELRIELKPLINNDIIINDIIVAEREEALVERGGYNVQPVPPLNSVPNAVRIIHQDNNKNIRLILLALG